MRRGIRRSRPRRRRPGGSRRRSPCRSWRQFPVRGSITRAPASIHRSVRGSRAPGRDLQARRRRSPAHRGHRPGSRRTRRPTPPRRRPRSRGASWRRDKGRPNQAPGQPCETRSGQERDGAVQSEGDDGTRSGRRKGYARQREDLPTDDRADSERRGSEEAEVSLVVHRVVSGVGDCRTRPAVVPGSFRRACVYTGRRDSRRGLGAAWWLPFADDPHCARPTSRTPAHRFSPARGPYRIANGASSSL